MTAVRPRWRPISRAKGNASCGLSESAPRSYASPSQLDRGISTGYVTMGWAQRGAVPWKLKERARLSYYVRCLVGI